MQFAGNFFDLIPPYALLAGVSTFLLFTLHGALYLSLKTEGEMLNKVQNAAKKIGVVTVLVVVVFAVMTFFETDLFASMVATIALLLCAVALILANVMLRSGKSGKAFVSSALTIVFLTASIFAGLFPRVMVSSLRPDWSLTIYNASSSPYTLKIMTIVALTLVPIVLAYQAWSYWVFRKRVTEKDLRY
ncbi:Cytochrome bd-I ubiquinol oxidase subunit 2 [bioreactor metagenome]|uniref:Cytochrome bd-I ubiquinol oxidase subunit 2 n=2 Tax=root TaxID=1 RepID=A0A645HTZ2_9ZZZZ